MQLAVVDGAGHGGRPFSQTLTQEVTSTPVYAGDVDGAGTALITVNVGRGEVCWHTSGTNVVLPATAPHIHHADVGIRGGIAIVLSPPDAAGEATGCRPGVDHDLLADLLQHPAAYYVNVHTTDFPSGAIRSQLEHWPGESEGADALEAAGASRPERTRICTSGLVPCC